MDAPENSTNRKRPREISSKVPVKRAIAKPKTRYDPRFECGEFDQVQYSRDYEFITHMRKREVKQLRKELAKEKDTSSEQAEQIRDAISRLENQIRSTDDQNAIIEVKAELRQQNIDRMNEGQHPIHINKQEMRAKIDEKRQAKQRRNAQKPRSGDSKRRKAQKAAAKRAAREE